MAAKTKTKTKTKTKSPAKGKAEANTNANAPLDQADVRAALERVINAPPNEAAQELLSAWRNFPCEEIALAVSEIPLDPIFADVTSANANQAIARLQRLAETPRDPRVSNLLISWVSDPPYHATSAKPFHTLLHEEIARHSDPRAIDDLIASGKAAAKVVKGMVMRKWIPERAARTADSIREAHPNGVPALPRGLAMTLLAAKKVAIAAAKESASTAPANKISRGDELLEAIWQDPSDDAARAVYADHLIEKGDPRGEFIALQLQHGRDAPTPEQKKREMALLSKNARRWLGELVDGAGHISSVSVGPGPSLYGARFERGFLTGMNASGTVRVVTRLTGHANLATVEEMGVHEIELVPFVIHPVLRSLRHLRAPPVVLAKIIELDPPCLRTITTLATSNDVDELDAFVESAAMFPSLTKVIFNFNTVDNSALISAAKSALRRLAKLEELVVSSSYPKGRAVFRRCVAGAEPTRAASGFQVTFDQNAGEALMAMSRSICS